MEFLQGLELERQAHLMTWKQLQTKFWLPLNFIDYVQKR